jgi:hypothetical protein
MMVSNCIAKFSRNLALGAALVAGFTLSATKEAGAQARTDAGSVLDLQAPFTTKFETGPGQFVTFMLTPDAGPTDPMRLHALYYDDDGGYVGFTSSAAASAPTASQTVQLRSRNVATVSLVYLYEGSSIGADDTIDNVLPQSSGFLIKPQPGSSGPFPAGDGLAALDFGDVTYTLDGASGVEIRNIARVAAVAGGAIPIGDYAGPVLQSAQAESLGSGNAADNLKLTFDAELDTIGAGAGGPIITRPQVIITTDPAATNQAISLVAPTIPREPVDATTLVVAGEKSVRFHEPTPSPDSFQGALLTVEVLSLEDCDSADLIRDRAGNCPVAAEVDVEMFGAPAFADRTAAVIATGGTCVDDQTEIEAFHSDDGQPCANGGTLVLTATLSEALGTGVAGINHIDDIALTLSGGGEDLEELLNVGPIVDPGEETSLFVPAGEFSNAAGLASEERCAAAASCSFTITFTGDENGNSDDTIRVNPENGYVEVALDGGEFESIWLALDISDADRTGGGVPTTEEDVALETKTSAAATFTSLRLTTPTFLTSDQAGGVPDGLLDGVDIRVGHAIQNALGDNHGVVLVDLDPPAEATDNKIDSTTSIVSAEEGVVRVTASTQASVDAISADPRPDGDLSDLATDRTSDSDPDIPYSLLIDDSTIMYANVYNPDTGERDTIPDQVAGATIGDGAAPIIQTAEFRPGASENTLEIGASENIKRAPATGFETAGFRIGTDEASSLQIDILNLDAGMDAAEIGGVDGSAFTISNVTALDIEQNLRLFLDASLPSNIVGNVDGENLIGAPGGTEITEGATTLDDPEIRQVFAMRNAEGDFVSVVVVMSHMVNEVADGMPGIWTATVEAGEPDDPTDDISVVFRQVEVTGENNVVTLEFPQPINGKVGITGGTLSFKPVDDDENGVPESGIKRVTSGDESPTYLWDDEAPIGGLPPADGTGAIFAQKVTGQVTGSGSGSAVVHASVVMPMTVPAAGPNSVCSVADTTTQLRLEDESDSILKAVRAGQRNVDMTLIKDDTGLRLVSADLEMGSSLPVRLNVGTGTVSGRGVSNCRLELTQSLEVASDPSIAILNDEGEFELVVGVNENIMHGANGNSADVTGCIFLAWEGMQFDEDGDFVRRGVVNLTSCDPAVGSPEEDGNYLAFSPSISGGQPAAAHIEVNVDQLGSFDIESGDDWQLAALAGAHRAESGNGDALVPHIFVCAGLGDDGAFDGPVSIIDDEGNLDELFSLNANDLRSFVEITETTSFNSVRNRDIGSNFAFAFRQEATEAEPGESGECSYLLNEDADGGFDLGRGWTLAKIGHSCGEEVSAVVLVGNDGVKIAINDEDNSDAVNDALAVDTADASVAFIYSPQGKQDFNACNLSL